MAFSYTVDTVQTGGKLAYTEMIFGNWVVRMGTWTAGGDTDGTITTGLTKVLAHSTNVDTGTITAEHTSKKNVVGAGTASDGDIGILACAADNVGSWMAIGYID